MPLVGPGRQERGKGVDFKKKDRTDQRAKEGGREVVHGVRVHGFDLRWRFGCVQHLLLLVA